MIWLLITIERASCYSREQQNAINSDKKYLYIKIRQTTESKYIDKIEI